MKKSLIIGALVIALIMLSVACSSPSVPKEDTGNGEPPVQDEGVSFDGTVTFGVTTVMTGTNIMVGDYINNGAELAAEEINANGGILGKELKLVFEDEVDNLQASVNAMTKLTNNKDVVSFFGSTYSSYCIAASPMLLEKKVPMFSGGTSANIVKENNPYMWQACLTDDKTGEVMAKVMTETLESKNPAIMYITDSFGTGLKDETVKALEELGITVSESKIFGCGADEKNFTPIIAQIANSDADCLLSINHETQAALICQQVEAAGIDIPLIASATVTSAVCRTNAGSSADGWYSVSEWATNVPTEVGKRFEEAYIKKYNAQPDPSAVIAYDSILLFKEACEIANTTTDKEAINDAISKIKDFPGAMSVYSYYGNSCLSSSKYLTINRDGEAHVLDIIKVR